MSIVAGTTSLGAMSASGVDIHCSQRGAHYYTAYGLNFRSDIRLPLVTQASAPADVAIRRGPVKPPAGYDGTRSWTTPEDIYFPFEKTGRIHVSHGNRIVVDAPEIDDPMAALFVIGPAMGAILHQRGLLVLHASAVVVNGHVTAFLGHSGWGKSTMAAAMIKLGAESYCDDLVPVSLRDGTPAVPSGYPLLKLAQESGEFLGFGTRDWTPITPDDPRCLVKVAASSTVALPLARIYVLSVGDRPEIEALDPQRAALELIRYSYAWPWVRNSGMSAHHLQGCAGLVHRVSVRNLMRPRRLDLIHEVAELVLADCQKRESQND